MRNAQKEYKRAGIPSKFYHRFMYKAKSWKYARRVIVQIRLYLHAVAYVLLHVMKTRLFTDTTVEDSSMMTLRENVLLSSVLIHQKKSKIHIAFTQNHPPEKELALVMRSYAILRSRG